MSIFVVFIMQHFGATPFQNFVSRAIFRICSSPTTNITQIRVVNSILDWVVPIKTPSFVVRINVSGVIIIKIVIRILGRWTRSRFFTVPKICKKWEVAWLNWIFPWLLSYCCKGDCFRDFAKVRNCCWECNYWWNPAGNCYIQKSNNNI